MVTFVHTLSRKYGLIVTLVLDSDLWHDSKRDSLKRKVKQEFAKINSYSCRQHAMSLGSKIDAGNLTDLDKARIKIFKKEANTWENSASCTLFLPSFKDNLQSKLSEIGAFEKTTTKMKGLSVKRSSKRSSKQTPCLLTVLSTINTTSYIQTNPILLHILVQKTCLFNHLSIQRGKGRTKKQILVRYSYVVTAISKWSW